MKTSKRTKIQNAGFVAGILLFILIALLNLGRQNPKAGFMAAVAVLMAVFWMTEALPLAVTSLLPLILFPIMGLLNANDTASLFFNSTIALFLGGFLLALAMERWNFHKRISILIIKTIGSSPEMLILGFLCSSAAISMFISNTATALMLLPIGLALVYKIEETFPGENTDKFSSAIMLSIAYGASVGGIATLIGTPPNLVFRQILKISFPQSPTINFGSWFIMGLPMTILMIISVWLILTKIMFRMKGSFKFAGNIIEDEYKLLGKTTYQEKIVFIVFIITCFLWIFRKKMELGALVIPGWSDGLPFTSFIDDGTIAIAAALSLFLIPSKSDSQPAILDNSVFKKLPWDIILLFGGGFALAEGFLKTGLSESIGRQFSVFSGVHPLVFVVIICTFVTFLTELTSNTATTQIILPILASLAVSLQVNPILFMIPATVSASFAFMLPVGTPPNAVAFSSGRIRIGDMARTGLLINLAGIIVVSIFFYYAGTYIFSIDPSVFPQWGMVGK